MQSNEPYERVFDGTGAAVGAGIGGVMSGGAVFLAGRADKTYDDRINQKHDNLKELADNKLQKYVNRTQKRTDALNYDFDGLQERIKGLNSVKADREIKLTEAEPGARKYRKLQNAEMKQYGQEQKHAQKINDIEMSRADSLRKGSLYSRHGGGWKNAVGIGLGAATGAVAGGFGTAALKRLDEQ